MVDPSAVEATLLHLLATPSYAGEERAVADWLRARLEALGAEVHEDDAAPAVGGNTGNLIAWLPGTVDAPPLFFNAHMDTVGRTEGLAPEVRDGVVHGNGATVLGSDDKAGVTAILEGVAAAVAAGLPRPPLELVFTVAEETGLHGAKAMDLSRLEAKQGFVFDGGTPLGEMTMSAPSQEVQHIVFHGRKSHAGVAPEQGINAIAAAALAITRIQQGRIDEETTVNVGRIAGGEATNIIADRCELHAEVRSRDEGKLTAQVAAMRSACESAAAETGCRLAFASTNIFGAFRVAPDEPLARLGAAAIEAVGLEPSYADGGGGSDANIFNAAGIRCLLMPCGQQQPHTHEEHVALADVATAARVVCELVRLGGQR